jgi:hypothetical protein
LWRACGNGQVGTGGRLVQRCRTARPEAPNGGAGFYQRRLARPKAADKSSLNSKCIIGI